MTTPEVSHVSDDATESVSVHEDIGYSKPFVPGEMTSAQAHQLHDVQHIGGKEAARIALRPEGPVVKTPEHLLAEAYARRDRSVLATEKLHQSLEAAQTNYDRAKIRKRLNMHLVLHGNILAAIDHYDKIVNPDKYKEE